jgi:putative DNA primase/helicase
VLDVENLEFNDGHQRELYFRSRLDFDFSEDQNCPKFLSWLEWAVGKDNVIIIRAFCRAVLVGYSTGERFLHLIGAGGSGKSTLQQVLIALAGYTGTHTSDLETIETNRFEGHSLIGKRLLLLTDEASFSRRLDTLKKLTSASDTLRAERKYGKEVINFKPELLVSIASNEHISSSDISSGLERRRLTIVMDKVVNPSKRRNLLSVYPDHIEGEFAPELPNIAAWALAMPHDQMREVLANPTKFAPTLNATNIEALIFNNPIVSWLAECTMYAPNSHTPLGAGALKPNIDEQERGLYVKNAFSEVYASYCNFAKCNGFRTIAKPRFVDRLRETTNNVLKVPGIHSKFINGKAVIQGLVIKPYDPSTDPRSRGDNRLPSPVDFAANPNVWAKAFDEHDPKPSNDDQ